MAAEFCLMCKARYGRIRIGVHRLGGEPACEECFHGGNEEAIARCRKSRLNVSPASSRPQEGNMECKTPGCGKRLNANNRLGYCTPCQRAGKHRHAGSGQTPKRTAAGSGRLKSTALAKIPKGNGGALPMIAFTPEVSFAIWRGLPPATQAALISKLPEVMR